MHDWMIYGANGYTGRLIAEEAARRGWRPVLAGRNREAIEALGARLGLPTRVFDLTEGHVADHLQGMKAVLHCAGPFSATFRPMLAGCMRAGAHYLDITGELAVYEALFESTGAIAEAGITAISGTGFDVVPTDCLAAMLHRALPDATRLRLALTGVEVISPGTAKTLVEGANAGGCIRRAGKLETVPAAYRTAMIPFEDRPSLAVTVPLADVVTAYHATGIPDIEVYVRANPGMVAGLMASRVVGPLLAAQPVQQVLKHVIGRLAHGPTAEQRECGHTVVWGEVENAAGRKVAMRLYTPEPYQLTITGSLAAIEAVLNGGIPLGAQSPAMAFGPDFVLALPGVRVETLS